MNTYRYFLDGNTVKSLNTAAPYVLPNHAAIIDELAVRNIEMDGGCSCVTWSGKFEAHSDVAYAVGETVSRRFSVCVTRHETKDDFGTTINFTILEN